MLFWLGYLILAGCEKKSESALAEQIFSPNVNVKAEIDTALLNAKKENKHVLLMFGANWCPWCHRLHKLFQEDETIKSELAQHYILVMVDLGRRDKNMDVDSLYGQPNKLGIPALVVLDQNGNQLCLQETGSMEMPKEQGKGHVPAKVLNFLRQWKPPQM